MGTAHLFQKRFCVNISKIKFAYFTPIMLTRQVVYNIVAGFGPTVPNRQCNLTAAAEREKPHELAPDELLIAAVPTFGGRVPILEPALLRNLHGNGSPAVVVVTYGARGYDDTLLEMKAILEEQGFVVIGGGAFVTMHSVAPRLGAGRPNADDLAKAREFGSLLRERVAQMPQPEEYPSLPGNIPFKDAPPFSPLTPTTNDACVLCMQCYRWCPVDAIPYNDPNMTHADRCILCHGCIVRCPVKARQVADETFQQRIAGLENSFAGNQPESEIFL